MAEDKQFEIKTSADKVLLRVRPPAEGEKKVNISEIQKELEPLQIPYDPEKLFAIFRRALNEFEPLAARETTTYEIIVTITPDGQEAHITVNPPTKGKDTLTPARFKQALLEAKVEKGIRYDDLKRVMSQHIEGKPVLIAKGQPPREGKDGWVDYLPENQAQSQQKAGDRIDYRELNLIENVEEGKLIARVIPPTEGVDGFTVTGKVLKGKNGTRAQLRLGAYVVFNEDQTEVRSTRGGLVVYTNDRISVEDLYQVEAVNSTTGNVRFGGVVQVKGNVEDGYVVEAGKGLVIGGTVGRTTIKAGGDISIGGGAMGTTIEAAGSVAAKFFADCTVKAQHDVLAEEYILHSTVEAGHAVHVTKPDIGFIKGGVTRAGQEIVSAVVGSEVSESDTRLEVGLGIDTRARYDRLQPQMSNNLLTFDRGRKNVQYLQQKRETEGTLSVPQMEQLQNAITQARKARDELLESLEQHHTLLLGLVDSSGRGVVLVPALAHAATVVQVQRFQTRVTNPLQACGFTIVDGQLRILDAPQVAKLMRQRKRETAA